MADQFDPVAFHRRNNRQLAASDVLVPAYPGSGHALLGNILLEAGLNYVDPYTESLTRCGGSKPVIERADYRGRLAALSRQDSSGRRRRDRRFVKTHLHPREFDASPNIVLLVRDPRDAIYSYYNWRLGFSEEGERDAFSGFLDRPNRWGDRPVADWTAFCNAWLARRESAQCFAVLRFEDLKRDGAEALEPFRRQFAPMVDRSAVARAVEASSFSAMRAHEDRHAHSGSGRRIMRSGKVGEWSEWMTEDLDRRFADPTMRELARSLGYRDWPGAG